MAELLENGRIASPESESIQLKTSSEFMQSCYPGSESNK